MIGRSPFLLDYKKKDLIKVSKDLPFYYWKDIGPHKYGCLMAIFPKGQVEQQIWQWIDKNIAKHHLSESNKEDRLHVTIKYGFTESSDQVISKLQYCLSHWKSFSGELGGLSQFKGGKDGDVLKVDISECGNLIILNKFISSRFEIKDKYPEYIPHLTLAYLKPEYSNLYENMTAPFIGTKINFHELEYKGKDDIGETFNLNKKDMLLNKRLDSSPFRFTYQMKSKEGKEEGKWVTINGAHVFINEKGEIVKGPKGMVGNKPSELGKEESHIGKSVYYERKIPDHLKRHGEKLSLLNDQEKQTVMDYTWDGYEKLNEEMRRCSPNFDCVQEDLKKKMNVIESAIEKVGKLEEPTIVYRGLSLNFGNEFNSLMDRLKKTKEEDGIFQMPSFTSTSVKPERVFYFLNSKNMHKTFVFAIRAKTGLYVQPITKSKLHEEIVQSPKTKYKVLDIKDKVKFINTKGKVDAFVNNVVYLEEVDSLVSGTKSLPFHNIKSESGWVTIGAVNHHGGTPVQLDEQGEIEKGPSGLKGKKITELKNSKVKESPFKVETAKYNPTAKVEMAKFDPTKKVEPPKVQMTSEKVSDYIGKPIKNVEKVLLSLIAHADDVITKLDIKEVKAVKGYTYFDYEDLNANMRECPPHFDCVEGHQKDQMEAIESAITKAGKLPEPVDVYRGIEVTNKQRKAILDELQAIREHEDDYYQMPSLTSTTVMPATAFGFSGQGKHSLVFHIKAKTGLYVQKLSDMGEHEVIQSAKTKYKVLDVKDDIDFLDYNEDSKGKTQVVYLEEI